MSSLTVEFGTLSGAVDGIARSFADQLDALASVQAMARDPAEPTATAGEEHQFRGHAAPAPCCPRCWLGNGRGDACSKGQAVDGQVPAAEADYKFVAADFASAAGGGARRWIPGASRCPSPRSGAQAWCPARSASRSGAQGQVRGGPLCAVDGACPVQ